MTSASDESRCREPVSRAHHTDTERTSKCWRCVSSNTKFCIKSPQAVVYGYSDLSEGGCYIASKKVYDKNKISGVRI